MGCPIPKMIKNFFLLWLGHFLRKMGKGDQNPNTLSNFSLYKIGFKKSSLKESKNTKGGGVKTVEKKSKLKLIFPSDDFPYLSVAQVFHESRLAWTILNLIDTKSFIYLSKRQKVKDYYKVDTWPFVLLSLT